MPEFDNRWVEIAFTCEGGDCFANRDPERAKQTVLAELRKHGVFFSEGRSGIDAESAEQLLREKQIQAANPKMSDAEARRALRSYPTAASFNLTGGMALSGLGLAQRAWELQYLGGIEGYAEASRRARLEFVEAQADPDKPLAASVRQLFAERARGVTFAGHRSCGCALVQHCGCAKETRGG